MMRLCVLALCVLIAMPVVAQVAQPNAPNEPQVDVNGRPLVDPRIAKLEQEVAELRKALAQLMAAVKAIPKQQPETSEELAKKSRKAMEKTCTDVGLRFKGVTAQQQPTQTIVVQCGP